MCVLLLNVYCLSIRCVHLSRGFLRPRTSIKQCLCYFSSVIAYAAKMLNITEAPFLAFPMFSKTFLCNSVSEHFPFSKMELLSTVFVKMERVTLPKRWRISTRLYGVIFQSLCVCICMYITYINADLRCACVQRKNIIGSIAAPLLLQPHEGCSQ